MNELITEYTKHLKKTFPSCSVGCITAMGQVSINVVWRASGDWFEMLVLFVPDISQEQFNSGREELARWEEEIAMRLKTKEG